MSKNSALLILNGDLDLGKEDFNNIIKKKKIDMIIAVDGGANKIKKLNLLPDLIIGDLDSITKKSKEYYRKKDVKTLQFPIEKDQTDSEIAVDYCRDHKIDKLYFTAALGGRIDQQLANLNLLEYVNKLNLKAKIISKNVEIALIYNKKQFIDKNGFRLSLIPQTKVVRGLNIKGCKYNLEDQDIERSQSRGISNLIEDKLAVVSIKNGFLIYVLEKLE